MTNNQQTENLHSYIEINKESLRHNLEVLRKAAPESSKIMAVVKAEAYGHGIIPISKMLSEMGVDAYAVATIYEGIELRKNSISGDILILGYTEPDEYHARLLMENDLIQTAIDLPYAQRLNSLGIKLRTHLKIDTGMHRLGIESDNVDDVVKALSLENLSNEGMFSHFCVADTLDTEDVEFSKGQIEKFYKLISALEEREISIPKLHIQGSYGMLNYPELECAYQRAGMVLYGVDSLPGMKTLTSPGLLPVLSLKSRVVLIRNIIKGETVGYGRTFTAPCDMKIGMIPVGYADGYPRSLSGVGKVVINGEYANIIGRICMDQFTVDLTNIKAVSVGDTAILIDNTVYEGISAPEVAATAGTIANELLCCLGKRLPVVIN